MKNILIVDDEYLIRFTLSETLQRPDAFVTSVATGKDALAELNRRTYELCFLDLHLPDANGLEVMKTIRAVSPATGIILMTGYEVDADVKQALQAQGCNFLPKPFDLADVQALVERLLGHAERPG